MVQHSDNGLNYFEGFSLFFLALWLLGAVAFGTTALMGSARVNIPSASAASNQTPVGDMPTQ